MLTFLLCAACAAAGFLYGYSAAYRVYAPLEEEEEANDWDYR